MQKILNVICLLALFVATVFAQTIDVNALYSNAMKEYKAKNYTKASEDVTKIINERGYKISKSALYNAACIYSLNNEYQKSLKILEHLATENFYSNFSQITNDSDLKNLHNLTEWKTIVEKIKQNKATEPVRKRVNIKNALLNAKDLLQKDNGKLWGKSLWHENVLFQDYEDTIYSLKKLKDSKTDDSILYYKKLPKDTLSKTNTVQEFEGEKYATVLATDFYMNDESATVIHELFHRQHFEVLDAKSIKLKADPVEYLDNFDARELLRLEYEALRKSLKFIDEKEDKLRIEASIKDAFLFRKFRQNKYKKYLQLEIEIETVEGLASYTGFALSTHPNKYKRAISGINGWENSATYTRPFPYATGPAYGLIFDYLKLNWKTGLDKVYNFLEIYESMHLKKSLVVDEKEFADAKRRNNFAAIHKEEIERKALFEKRTKFYTEMLIKNPTLQVTLVNNEYSLSFNMNGTLNLKDIGIVYSGAKGKALNNSNFGSFVINPNKSKLGVTGVLSSRKNGKTKYTFPLPITFTGKKIIGEFYEIELNDGWEIVKKNAKGDLEIIKSELSANDLIGKVSDKFSNLKKLSFEQTFRMKMPARKYESETVFKTFLDLSSNENNLGFKSQLKSEDSEFIYNGSEFFTLMKNTKKLDVRAKPKVSDVSGFMGFLNSLVMLRNALPTIAKDKSIEKTIAEKRIDGKDFYELKITFKNRSLDVLGSLMPTRKPDKVSYRVLIDKSNFMPTDIIQSFASRDMTLQTSFSKYNFEPKYPTKRSWQFSSYLGEYEFQKPWKESLIKSGVKAPDFTLSRFKKDSKLTLSEMKGKLVLLEFWITHCGFCVKAVPDLNKIQKEFGSKDFRLISINSNDSEQIIEGFRKENKPEYEILHNAEKITNDYGVRVFPTVVLIDREGKIIFSGLFNAEEMRKLIRTHF